MKQSSQGIQSTRGRKQGSNKIELNPQNEWAFLPKSKSFLGLIINEGRHVKLHISGKQSEQRKEILKRENGKKVTYKTVEKVVEKYFKDTISNPEQVIYFFRAPNKPHLTIQETVKYLENKFSVELKNNQEIKKLQNQFQLNTEEVQNPPVAENKGQCSNLLNPNKQECQRNFSNCYNEQDGQFFSEQDSGEQNNNQQIKDLNLNKNPFLLDFIDPDLAKELEKIWYLLKKEFIFELVLMFYAKKNDLDVTNILLSMKTENDNFPEILQNIFIQKILNNDSRINDLINEELQQFRYKFQELFVSKEAKVDVENFYFSIYSIVKLAEENQYKESTQVKNAPQRLRQDIEDECKPIKKKVKFHSNDEIEEPPVFTTLMANELELGEQREQQIYEDCLNPFLDFDFEEPQVLPTLIVNELELEELGEKQIYKDQFKRFLDFDFQEPQVLPTLIVNELELPQEKSGKNQVYNDYVEHYFCGWDE